MPFNLQAHQQKLFAHYLRLAQTPGWLDYSIDRCKTLAAEQPDMYRAFPAKLKQELHRIALAPASQPNESLPLSPQPESTAPTTPSSISAASR